VQSVTTDFQSQAPLTGQHCRDVVDELTTQAACPTTKLNQH